MELPRNTWVAKHDDGARDGAAAAIEMVNAQVKKVDDVGTKAQSKDQKARGGLATGMLTPKCFGLKMLGVRGLLGFCLSFFVGFMLGYAYFQFSRMSTWYILVLSIVAILVPIKTFTALVFTPSSFTADLTLAERQSLNNKKLFQWKFKDFYNFLSKNVLDTDGKYYFCKTLVSEFFEFAAQTFALRVCSCNLPAEIVAVFYYALAGHAAFLAFETIWSLHHGMSIHRRNMRVMGDIVIDILTGAVPLMHMYGNGMPFNEVEILQCALVPACFSISKTDECIDAVIRERAIAIQNSTKKSGKTRISFFQSMERGEDLDQRIAKLQNRHTPRPLRIVFSAVALVYTLYLLVVSSLQLALLSNLKCSSSKDATILWEACKVKVPYCKSIVSPSCDCAILSVLSHNWTSIPKSVGDMTALKMLQMERGPLANASGLTKLPSLKVLYLKFNKLESVPEALGSVNLIQLNLAFNRLKKLPDSMWTNIYMKKLDLSNNFLSTIPLEIAFAESLGTLRISNNSFQAIPAVVFTMKSLQNLYLDGNNITYVGEEIGNLKELADLTLHNNVQIRSIPSAIGAIRRLDYFDIRNNTIAALPEEIANLPLRIGLYLSNNPVCSNGWLDKSANLGVKAAAEKMPGAGCNEQCSPYCAFWLREMFAMCTRECDSSNCKFHDGHCAQGNYPYMEG